MTQRYLLVPICLAILALSGCASIYKKSTFHECTRKECPHCQGRGLKICTACNGKKTRVCSTCRGKKRITCSKCNGIGQKDGKVCEKCNGQHGFDCSRCGASGVRSCSLCRGAGTRPCGQTTTSWICRKCGRNFDYPPKGCPDCDRKK